MAIFSRVCDFDDEFTPESRPLAFNGNELENEQHSDYIQ